MGAIVSRDALAGAWRDDAVRNGLSLKSLDDDAPLAGWEPWVRGTVFDVEALQGLGFAAVRDDGQPAGRASVRGLQLQLAGEPVVTLLRPKNVDAQTMRNQVRLVYEYAELRPDRQAEVLSQIPQLVSYWTSIAGLHPSRTKYTLELMGVAIRLAIHVEMRFKHAFAVPRPVQFSPQVQPMIQTPSHSAFPSGHATEAHCVAATLMAVSGQSPQTPVGQMLLRQAARIAINRTVAGVHFPIDSFSGQALGLALADLLRARAESSARFRHRWLDAADLLDEDFLGFPQHRADPVPKAPARRAPASGPLAWLWGKAREEWV